jgi:hypothetical protein
MANEELLFRGIPRLVGDPPQLLEALLAQVESKQQKQVMGLFLDSLATTLQANLTFIQGVRSIIG